LVDPLADHAPDELVGGLLRETSRRATVNRLKMRKNADVGFVRHEWQGP
jgi:hypothetical protein